MKAMQGHVLAKAVYGGLFRRPGRRDHMNRIEVVPYDPGWPAAFEQEALRLRTALGTLALRVDHNGSTSIPGLAAKPVIDIQVSVASLQPLAEYGDRLESIGYVHVPHEDDSFCPFFHRPRGWPHSHHVHVVRAVESKNGERSRFEIICAIRRRGA